MPRRIKDRIVVREHQLTFEGHPADAKTLAEELRELSNEAGRDLGHILNDFTFLLETEYQAFYGLDQDDWGRAPSDPYSV